MFRNGFKTLREIADFWEHLIVIGDSKNPEKSMRSSLRIWKEIHIGFNHKIQPRVGDFFWIEYGHNLEPEMSFEHIGLIIKIEGRLLYSIPITTPKASNPYHVNAFHAVDNPAGNNLFIKLKTTDFPFLKHDSLAKVSEIKAISKKRLGSKLFHMDISNPLIEEIIELAHRNLFSIYDYKINQLIKENSFLNLKLELIKVPNEINNESEIVVDTLYSKEITKKSNDILEVKLTDKYGQTDFKNIHIKKSKQS